MNLTRSIKAEILQMFISRNSKYFSLIYYVQTQSFSVISKRHQSDYTGHEKSRIMRKLLDRNVRAKKKWYQPHLGEPNEVLSFFKSGKKAVNEAQKTRARQLSHVLYDKISELINSDELSIELVDKQVLITTVKMLDNFSGINVYWDCNRSDAFEVETLLQSCSGKLRSLLISYHILGHIPPVTFVKDKSFIDLALLNQMFEVADYGPDYIPTTHQKPKQNNTSQQMNEGEISNADVSPRPSNINLTQIINDIDDDTKIETESSVMSNSLHFSSSVDLKFHSDIYGLPRDKLFKKVMAQKIKVRFQEPETESSLGDALREYKSKQLNVQKDRHKL
ncbi:hypothetical protein Btru_068196 [Bulinus truncatus]|nr:hypothetical protein Btru_068196 [Bulinus truncatus]